MLDNEELFQELLPAAVRRKQKRRLVGLVVQTVFFIGILIILG